MPRFRVELRRSESIDELWQVKHWAQQRIEEQLAQLSPCGGAFRPTTYWLAIYYPTPTAPVGRVLLWVNTEVLRKFKRYTDEQAGKVLGMVFGVPGCEWVEIGDNLSTSVDF